MTTLENPAPVVKPKLKKKRRAPARKPAVAKPPVKADDYPGMTITDCAKACGAEGCVLGTSYCAHPRKGGLHGVHLGNPKLVENLQKARKHLAFTDATKRFS